MKHTTFSMDIAKNVFEIAVSYEPGIVRETHRVARAKFLEFFAKREKGTVVMEACSFLENTPPEASAGSVASASAATPMSECSSPTAPAPFFGLPRA
jgi:hypothetical protein